MNQNTKDDIQRLIYENKIEPPEAFEQFISVLDDIGEVYTDRATIRTRNENNRVLTSFGTNYFTYVERGATARQKTIFAGALEKTPRSNKGPAVRVRSSNQYLSDVSSLFRFPFGKDRSPEWTNVNISTATIDILSRLLHSEVENYLTSPTETEDAIR